MRLSAGLTRQPGPEYTLIPGHLFIEASSIGTSEQVRVLKARLEPGRKWPELSGDFGR
jgi:hypothetical protein